MKFICSYNSFINCWNLNRLHTHTNSFNISTIYLYTTFNTDFLYQRDFNCTYILNITHHDDGSITRNRDLTIKNTLKLTSTCVVKITFQIIIIDLITTPLFTSLHIQFSVWFVFFLYVCVCVCNCFLPIVLRSLSLLTVKLLFTRNCILKMSICSLCPHTTLLQIQRKRNKSNPALWIRCSNARWRLFAIWSIPICELWQRQRVTWCPRRLWWW